MRKPTALFLLILLIVSGAACATTISEARNLPDGSAVSLLSKQVTAIFSSDSAVYIQEPDSWSAIKIVSTGAGLATGDYVDVTGTMGTDNISGQPAERKIVSATVTKNSSGFSPSPVHLSCRAVGGSEFPYGSSNPFIVSVNEPYGPNTIGTLVKICGNITSVNNQYFWVDDGLGLAGPSGNASVLVKYPTTSVPYISGDFVAVTGIVRGSVPVGWSTNQRMLQTRDYSDVLWYESTTGAGQGTIDGTVTSGGSPLSGVTVSTDRYGYSAVSASDGTYSISPVIPGTYTLTASKSGYIDVIREDAGVTSGTTTTEDFDMQSINGTISGYVYAPEDNSPIGGVAVSTDTGGYSTTTASDGSYTFSNVTPGTYTITASEFGYTPQSADITLPAGGSITRNLYIENPGPFTDNGGFEKGFTSAKGNGWSSWSGPWSNAITFSDESSRNFAGYHSQKWGRSDSSRFQGGISSSVSTIPGVMYEVNAWLKMDADEPTAWLAAGYDLTGQTTNGEAASVIYTDLEDLGDNRWHRYNETFTATSATTSFFTKAGQYDQTDGPNYAWVDNVNISPRTVLEAEDYDNYSDTTSGNEGGVYRTDDVDIAEMPGGDGYFVGWTANSEYLEWTNVGSVGGAHVIIIDYAADSNSTVRLRINGTSVTGNISLPDSGGYESFRKYVYAGTVNVPQSSTNTVKLEFLSSTSNIDKVSLVPVDAYLTLQAEDYTDYYDTTSGNDGGLYRTDDVDISEDSPGQYFVGWTASGEWLDYGVNGDGRSYVAVIRHAGPSSASASISLNGNDVTGSVTLPSTGDWYTWGYTISPSFTLPTGENELRFDVISAGFNVDSISLVCIGDGDAANHLLAGVHFAGNPTTGLNTFTSVRNHGNWIYTTEVYANGGYDPDTDPGLIGGMNNWINNTLAPIYNADVTPIVRIDWKWGEVVPHLLSGNTVDTVAVSRYARTFRKFAELANAAGVPVRHFIVGNEMNLKSEAANFTNGYIPEWYYAYVYDEVRAELSTLGPGYELLVGAVSPGTTDVDPLQTPGTLDPNIYSTDGMEYIENVIIELKRKGTEDVGFALHAYADFDSNEDYTISFYWTLRRQLEFIEKDHTVVPYGETDPVTIDGFHNAPVYLTEWNRHTPVDPWYSRSSQETKTADFIRTAVDRIVKLNHDRKVWDNVSNVYRTYDHRGVEHNYHPIKGLCYFTYKNSDNLWSDYALEYWHTLEYSATGSNDMYNAYQEILGMQNVGGR